MSANKSVTILAALVGGLFSAAAAAESPRVTGVGAHIADQGNRALIEVRQQTIVAVKTSADKGLSGNLERVHVGQSREISVGGGGPVAPKDVSGSRYTIDSTCP